MEPMGTELLNNRTNGSKYMKQWNQWEQICLMMEPMGAEMLNNGTNGSGDLN